MRTVAEVIATVFVGVGGMLVIRDKMSVGSFVTIHTAIQTFGGTTATIFKVSRPDELTSEWKTGVRLESAGWSPMRAISVAVTRFMSFV